MNAPAARPARAGLEIAAVLARWLLGGLFVWLGLSKALHPVEFLKLVRQYELTGNFVWLNVIAGGLPWFEVFCGVLLVAGVAVRGTALLLILMLIPFSAAVLHRALALKASLGIPFCAVKFDCGCGSGEVHICGKLLENAALLLLAAWLLTGRGRRFSARFELSRKPASPADAG